LPIANFADLKTKLLDRLFFDREHPSVQATAAGTVLREKVELTAEKDV
jgi:hypothetical protein